MGKKRSPVASIDTNFTLRWLNAKRLERRRCKPTPCHVPTRGWLSILTLLIVDPRPAPVIHKALAAVPLVPLWYFTSLANHGIYGHDRIVYRTTNVTSRWRYQRLLKSSAFWTMLPTEMVLLFEADVRFCNQPTFSVEHFVAEMIEYEYTLLGAPWFDDSGWCLHRGRCTGNSGLSLWNARSVRRLMGTLEQWTLTNPIKAHKTGFTTKYEIDAFVHQQIASQGGRYAPTELAEKFSMEHTRRLAWFTPFGCHSQSCCGRHGDVHPGRTGHSAHPVRSD